jgi:hypothetical protein
VPSKLLLILATAFLLPPAFANVGGICCPFSDATLKTNVEPLTDATQKVLQMRGVSFDWKAGKQADIGVIAQEVQKVYPQLVKEKGGHLQVDYEKLVAPLIEATRELDARIKALETAKPAHAH